MRLSRNLAAMAFGLAALFANTGCGEEESVLGAASGIDLGGLESDPAAVFPDSLVFDSWVVQGGSILPSVLAGAVVTAVDVGDQGLARVYFHDSYTNANDCVRAFALFDGRTLALDLSRERSLAFLPDRAEVFPIVVVESTFMGVANAEGQVALLSRQPVPPSLGCAPLPVTGQWTVPQPSYFTDLVLYQGDLVYTSQDRILERFDPETGTMLANLGSTNRFVQTTQGSHFWSHCACGGSPDAFRHDLTTTYDVIETDEELGEFVTIRAAAYQTTTGLVWLHGASSVTSRHSFYLVDASGEPDELVDQIDFNRSVRALAFDGSDLWAIVAALTPAIIRIDPNAGRAVETYEVPDEDVDWNGLVFDAAGDLYLLGTDVDGSGVIVQSSMSTASLPL